MKLRTIRYLVKEGLANTFRNKLMFFASMATVTASLIVLGVFILIGVNVNSIKQKIESSLTVQVFLDPTMKQHDINIICKEVKNLKLGKVSFVSKKKGFEILKNMDIMKKHENALEGYSENLNFMPSAIMVVVDHAENAKRAVSELKSIRGIKPEDVIYHKDVVDKILKIMKIVEVVSIVVLVMLASIAILIISNTIKLTVFARRKEIGIMKYIGATDFFINLPFLIESIMLGIISSLIALFIVCQGYGAVINYFKVKSIIASVGINGYVAFGTVSYKLLAIYLVIGVGMGCVGSTISMRKYLKV